MKPVKAVIFDMDGLMFDTEKIYYQSNQKTADAIGLPFDSSVYERYIGASDADFYEGMLELWQDSEALERFKEESTTILHHAMRYDEIGVKTGLLELLQYLEEKGIKRIVASSSYRDLVELLLERTGMRPYIQEIVGGDEVEKAKPHPEIFLKAWEKTGFPKENVVVLEDSFNGVKAAHAAGIQCIMVPDFVQPTDDIREKTFSVHTDLTEVLSFFKTSEEI